MTDASAQPAGVFVAVSPLRVLDTRPAPEGLVCTDPGDVLADTCSTPPGEDASDEQLARLGAEVARCFSLGGGTMTITKDTGCFVCARPVDAV